MTSSAPRVKKQQSKFFFVIRDVKIEDFIDTYKAFIEAFGKQKWPYYEKTIKSVLGEIAFVSRIANIPFAEFCNNIGIDKSFLTDRQIALYQNRKYRKLPTSLEQLCNDEITSDKTHKMKTEVVMKYLIYTEDWDNFALMLNNKIYLMLRNTNILMRPTKNSNIDDIISDFLIQIIGGFKKYRVRLFWDKWHSTKVLSYLDRIIRNTSATLHVRSYKYQNEYTMSELSSEYASSANEDDDGTNLQDILMHNNSDMIVETQAEFKPFDYWKYIMKYVPPINHSSSSILEHDYIQNVHHMQYDNGEFYINDHWLYFVSKATKTYDVHGKIINSYFDIVCMMRDNGKTQKEIIDYLFWDMSVKFLIVDFENESIGNIYPLWFKDKKLNNIFKTEHSAKKQYTLAMFQKLVTSFIAYLYSVREIDHKQIASYYGIIRVMERIFIDNIYEWLYNHHNVELMKTILHKYTDYNTYDIIFDETITIERHQLHEIDQHPKFTGRRFVKKIKNTFNNVITDMIENNAVFAKEIDATLMADEYEIVSCIRTDKR